MTIREPSDVLDELLILRCQGGEADAFQLLVKRWHPRLLRHALRFTKNSDAARDIAQESWMGIVKGLSKLDNPTRFRPWAYRIVANRARDWVRREQVRRRHSDTSLAPDTTTYERTETELVDRLRQGMARLEPEQRLILTWFYLEDMPIRDIADALSVPVGTVKSRLFHARTTLKTLCEEDL